MRYSFRLAARVLLILYALFYRQENTYNDLFYTSRGALAETRNSSMGPPWRIDPTTHRTIIERFYISLRMTNDTISQNTQTRRILRIRL